MEATKPTAAAAFSSDLFGEKDASASANSPSSGLFSLVFPSASTMIGRESSHFDSIKSWRKQDPELQISNDKMSAGTSTTSSTFCSNVINQGSENDNRRIANKDKSSVFLDEMVESCSLSSSLYYGGQDVCFHASNTQALGTPTISKSYGGEEDPNVNNPNSASRGNWWEGSLYY